MIIVQVNALLDTLELTVSALRKGHFSLYNCLVLGHTKYSGVQRVYCNPFPAKPFHGCHRLDPVMIRPPGIDDGAFVVSPDSVWYARVLLLFTATWNQHAEAPCLGHSPPRSDGSMPILAGSSSSGGVSAGACLV